jgi:hypothetical protein
LISLDPRLERVKPALVHDPQEAYRAMSAASITDNRDNVLKRENGAVVSRAGSGLTLALLAAYDVRRVVKGDHPIVYVAPLSHACYFEPGSHPYAFGVDNPDDTLAPVLPKVEEFGTWSRWTGRWGASRVVGGGKFGGRSPAGPGQQGQKWDNPPRGTVARRRPSRCDGAAASFATPGRRPIPS